MASRSGFAACVALGLTFAPACGSERIPGSAGFVDDGDAGVEMTFRPPTTLTLEPREASVLELSVSPPGVYSVRFALLPGEGTGPGDAVLDQSEVTTDEDGIAHVTLTAPSGPTSFSVRATIEDEATTSLPVSVSAAGFVSLEVAPAYEDDRNVDSWVASVHVGVSCESLSDLLSESVLFGEASFPEAAIVEDVPVGVPLAVTARAGKHAAGCSNVAAVVEGPRQRVLVTLNDLPIRLDRSRLAPTLSLEMSSPEWVSASEREIEAVQQAMLGEAEHDFGALLDTMQELARSSEEFGERRAAQDWDAELLSAYGGAGSALRDAAGRWMREGQLALAEPGAIEAELVPLPGQPDRVLLTFTRVAGSTGSAAGLSGAHEVGWSADANDMVLIGGDVAWYPAQLFGAAALPVAQAEFGSADTIGDALALSLNCTAVASELASAYAGCSLFCTSSLCTEAVQVIWDRSMTLVTPEPSVLEFSASAQAKVGDAAEIVSLDGDWVGRWAGVDKAATAGGPLEAMPPDEQEP